MPVRNVLTCSVCGFAAETGSLSCQVILIQPAISCGNIKPIKSICHCQRFPLLSRQVVGVLKFSVSNQSLSVRLNFKDYVVSGRRTQNPGA